MGAQQNERLAIEFLRMAAMGSPMEARRRYVAPTAVHHNVHFERDWDALARAMEDANARFPRRRFEVKRSVAAGDEVVLLSHMVHEPGSRGIQVVHWFRFDGERIVEMWDVGQQVPEDSPNAAGAF